MTYGAIAVSVAYTKSILHCNLVHYYYEGNCKVNGFFNQYLGSVLLLFSLAIGLIFSFKISSKVIPSLGSVYQLNKAKMKTFTYHGWEINKLEVPNLAVIVVPLVIDWIPFITNSYGLFGTCAGFPYLIKTAPYTRQDCGNRSGYGISLLELLLF